VGLGCGSFHEYAEWLFGYRPKLTKEKLRVAEALEELPEMARELESGGLCFSAVKELTRVATAETEQEWLEAARGRVVHDIEKMVSGRRPGSRPGDPPDPKLGPHVLRFEVSGEVLATFNEALAKIRRDSGEPLNDDAALLLLARQVLEGPRDEGRASYQIAYTVCESCGRGEQHGRGELVPVSPEIVEMACCDAQHVGRVDGEPHVGHSPKPARATQTIPPAVRRAVSLRDHGQCRVPGCRNAVFLDLHHRKLRSRGGENTTENLVTLCGAHHRAVHYGRLFVESSPAGLRFFHADGRVYGSPPSSARTDERAKAESALTLMGFPAKQVKLG
jgi:hypothetical protein